MVIWLFPGEEQENQKYKIIQTIVTVVGLAGEKKKEKKKEEKTKHNPITSRWHSAVVHNRKKKKKRLKICYVVLN
jgi:hypothetical protein